jgi:hypothetical protein
MRETSFCGHRDFAFKALIIQWGACKEVVNPADRLEKFSGRNIYPKYIEY